MPSSSIVPQRVLLLTIAAVLVDFMPSVAALRCSIGAKITMEYDDDSLEMMKKKIPLIELLGELEAFRMLFKLDGIIQCPAGATRCMTAQCTFNLNSLPEVPAKYRDLLDDQNLMIIFRACAPRVGCNTDALQGPLDDHDLQQGPFPMKRRVAPKCKAWCCSGKMCNGAIGLLVHKCGTFATILATFYAFFFLRYM